MFLTEEEPKPLLLPPPKRTRTKTRTLPRCRSKRNLWRSTWRLSLKWNLPFQAPIKTVELPRNEPSLPRSGTSMPLTPRKETATTFGPGCSNTRRNVFTCPLGSSLLVFFFLHCSSHALTHHPDLLCMQSLATDYARSSIATQGRWSMAYTHPDQHTRLVASIQVLYFNPQYFHHPFSPFPFPFFLLNSLLSVLELRELVQEAVYKGYNCVKWVTFIKDGPQKLRHELSGQRSPLVKVSVPPF